MAKVYVGSTTGVIGVYTKNPAVTAAQVAAGSGVTDPAYYQEFSDADFQESCYNFYTAFSLSGGVVSFDLSTAKTQAKTQAKAATDTASGLALNSFSLPQIAAQASLPAASRTPEIQSALDNLNILVTELTSTLVSIDAATTIDEVNNIVNPPTGILFTGRGGGLGPLDLNVSYYTLFDSASMLEAETELYVPGTSTVIPYGSYPGGFDSMGNCFNLGDYTLQIRETATGSVIAEFECPLAPAGEDVSF